MKDVSLGNENIAINPGNTVGFYSWNVPENRVHGDEVIARIFGVAQTDLASGVAIEVVIRNVDEEDKPRVAKGIHDAIISGRPYQENYGITHPDGGSLNVTSIGRCLRDSDGVPSFYTGTVTIQLSAAVPSEDLLEAHCSVALGLARKGSHLLAARYLSSALNVLGK